MSIERLKLTKQCVTFGNSRLMPDMQHSSAKDVLSYEAAFGEEVTHPALLLSEAYAGIGLTSN
jgi:hypothetical protein